MLSHAAIALAAVLTLALSAPASAQSGEFSDGQLKSFAMAWTSINQLAEQWKPQVEAAASQDQAAEMLQQFEAEANQVIERTDGIGTAEYESIMQAAQTDEDLKQRIYAMLQEMQPQQ
jgi:cell division protein FtsX